MGMSKSAAGPNADADVRDESVVAVLNRLADGAAVSFDATAANRAVRRAVRDVSPTANRAARLRLTQAAAEIGLLVLHRHLSPREAIGSGVPLAIFAVSPSGAGNWYILQPLRRGHARLIAWGDRPLDLVVTPEDLAAQLGAAGPDAVLEWLFAQPTPAMPPGADLADEEESHADDHHGPSPVRRLFRLLRPEMRDLRVITLYAIGVGILSLVVPVTVMAVVNSVALTTLPQQLVVLCAAVAISLGLAALFRGLQTVVVEYLQQRVFARTVADLAYRLPRVEMRALDEKHGPELVNRFFDVLTVQKACAILLLDGVGVLLQMVIGLALLATYHHMLLSFDILLIGALAFIIGVLGRGAVTTAIRESKAKYKVAAWLEEVSRHPAAFKLGGAPRFAWERADALTRKYLAARHEHFRTLLRQLLFALGLQVVASTALLAIGGYLVFEEKLSLGQLVAAEIVVTLVVASFAKLHKQLETYYDLLAAVDKLGHLMDLPLEREGGAAHLAGTGGATVRVRNLCFGYSTDRPIVNELSFEVAAGERVAIVGPNGAGKSTLIDLLFGLRTPAHGSIEIDGTDIRDLRLESLREHVAVVKGIEVFDGTVIENVRMGREEITVGDIRAALETVGLWDDILDLPMGLGTRLGAGGAPLSLGQAERLMLARAIAGQPRLLVIDETLDNLDRDARRDVWAALLGPDARWTLIIVTHGEDVADLCDRQIRLAGRSLMVAEPVG